MPPLIAAASTLGSALLPAASAVGSGLGSLGAATYGAATSVPGMIGSGANALGSMLQAPAGSNLATSGLSYLGQKDLAGQQIEQQQQSLVEQQKMQEQQSLMDLLVPKKKSVQDLIAMSAPYIQKPYQMPVNYPMFGQGGS